MNVKPDSQVASPIRIAGIINRLTDWRSDLQQGNIKRRLHLQSPNLADQGLIKDLRALGLDINLDEISQVEEATATIKAWLQTAPVVHLTFSTIPSLAIQAQIIDWLHQEIHPDVLADFRADGQLAAGFLLRTRNRMFDFSVNGLLWQNRQHLGELVKNVR